MQFKAKRLKGESLRGWLIECETNNIFLSFKIYNNIYRHCLNCKIMKIRDHSFLLFQFLFYIIPNLIYAQLAHKAPYLIYNGNQKEMQVLWQLYATDTCQIKWGIDTSYSLGSVQTYEYGSNHQHTYTIKNLTPATKYY
jgi:hypothetical protein